MPVRLSLCVCVLVRLYMRLSLYACRYACVSRSGLYVCMSTTCLNMCVCLSVCLSLCALSVRLALSL
eukprot:UN17126